MIKRTHQEGVEGFLILCLLAYTPNDGLRVAGMINTEVFMRIGRLMKRYVHNDYLFLVLVTFVK